MTGAAPTLRIDRWLWHARFFKTRSLAARVVSSGSVRVNGVRVAKPAHPVRPGDVLTFPQARRIRVVAVCDLGVRRGPATEAAGLYEDRSPPSPPGGNTASDQPAARPGGRPTGRERRILDRITRQTS